MFRRLRTTTPHLLLLLAPRHPQRFADVELLYNSMGILVEAQPARTRKDSTIGVFTRHLGRSGVFLSRRGRHFVGGSLIKGPGGHSVVEPRWQKLGLFGPYGNFIALVEQLMQAGGGFMIRTEEDAYQQLLALFSNLPKAREAGRRAHQVIVQGQGAVQRTMTVVLEALQESETNLRHSDS